MKPKKLCIMLALIFLLQILASCAKNGEEISPAVSIPSYNGIKAELTAFASPELYVASMEKIAEDSHAVLYCDTSTANVAVYDKESGQYWFSAPWKTGGRDTLSQTQKELISSPVILTYMDTQHKVSEFNSFRDCAEYGQLKSEPISNGIRLTMTIGKLSQSEVIPEVLPENSMLALEEKLEAADYKYIKQSYRRLELKGDGNDDELLKQYSGLKGGAVYVIRSNMASQVKSKLAENFAKAGYTYKQLEADEKAVYGTAKTEVESSANFTVTLEYTLENGDLVARIPMGDICYDESKYTLIDLTLLKYFGAADAEDNGFILLPDGSGAVCEYTAGKMGSGVPFEADLYGRDAVYQYDPVLHTAQNLRVPVFGNEKGSGGFIAIAEEGDAQCTLRSVVDESETLLRYSHFICHVRLSGMYVHSEYASLDEYMRATPNAYVGDYCLRYRFLSDTGYSGMAQAYREYLLEKGALKQNNISEDPSLFVELLGAVDARYSGVFSNYKLYPLTTYEEVGIVAEELVDEGINNLNIKLTGWANGGLNNTLYSKAKPISLLGGKKAFSELSKLMADRNIGLYPETDISFVYKEGVGDNFSLSRNAARQLDNTYARIFPYNQGSGLGKYEEPYYAVNSRSLKKYAKSLVKTLPESLKGLSLGRLGDVINSDSNASSGSRTDALNDYRSIAEQISKDRALLVTGGNAYTWAYASGIEKLPSSYSGYHNTSYSIPFLQMVLHGYLPYTGESLNLAQDPHKALLKAIENGEDLSFVMAYKNSKYISLSDYTKYHSVDYEYWKTTIIKDYEMARSVLSGTASRAIVKHEYLTPQVVKVTYDGGKCVYVNYSDEEYTSADVVVAANSAIAN